jgi:hypothetical protein
MLEQWHIWQPLKKMTGEYRIQDCINDKFCGLRIILEKYNAQAKTEVHIYVDSVEAYRVTNETYKLNLWVYLSDTHKDLNRRWSLFIIENSTFLKSLSEESQGISDSRHLRHYCIMDSEWSLDIAVSSEPIVKLMVDDIMIESSPE